MGFDIPPEETRPEELSSESETPVARTGPWGSWPTIGFSAVIFVIYVFAQSVVAIIFAFLYSINELASNPELDPLVMVNELTTNGLLISVATVVSAVAGAGIILLFVKVRRGISLRNYMALHPLNLKTVLTVLAVAAVLLAIYLYLARFAGESQSTGFSLSMYETAGCLPLLWIAIIIFAPVFEEAFFRGFLFTGLVRSFLGPAGTIFLTALLFAAIHGFQYDLFGIATIFVLGIALGIVRHKSGSLWSTILLHSVWNLAGLITIAIHVGGVG
ncbi:MAG: CPBP family intramembrane metalloprotease [Dehalococcoidales bacterium]|nr:CPBP family intramembrane metalloprotease [Dehalococcoidales bacterium]